MSDEIQSVDQYALDAVDAPSPEPPLLLDTIPHHLLLVEAGSYGQGLLFVRAPDEMIEEESVADRVKGLNDPICGDASPPGFTVPLLRGPEEVTQ